VLFTTSCEKDPVTDPVNQTLSLQYPDWKNLGWVSTNGASLSTTYPRLTIIIGVVLGANNGEEVIAVTDIKLVNNIPTVYNNFYETMTVTPTSVKFSNGVYAELDREYVIKQPFTDKKITLTYLGNDYVLQKP
jgi:hypothetical protein